MANTRRLIAETANRLIAPVGVTRALSNDTLSRLGRQVHISRTSERIDLGRKFDISTDMFGKPQGGFWTSSEDTAANWGDMFGGRGNWFNIYPDPDARVFKLSTKADLKTAVEQYPLELTGPNKMMDEMLRQRNMPGVGSAIDYTKMAQDYDAVNFSGREILGRSHFSEPDDFKLNTLDFESTFWFRPKYRASTKLSTARQAAMARDSVPGYIDDPARLDPINFGRR
jgi:hypothetical protein